MKMRNFANRLLLIALLAVLGCAQGLVHFTPLVVTVAAEEATTTVTKTYYFDQYNDNAPTGESLYDAMGIKVYNDYLAALDAVQGLNDVVIAVVDSGLNTRHPVFNGRILSDYAMDFSQGITDQMHETWNEDLNGHGTHVAGVLADMTLANVQILPIRIFYDLDNKVDDYALENAVRYLCALKTGSHVRLLGEDAVETKTYYNESRTKLNIVAVNLSLGTKTGYDANQQVDLYKFQRDKYGYRVGSVTYTGYQHIINRLLRVRILPIVAAGNKAESESKYRTYYSLPGACDGVVAVGAYDNTDDTDGLYWSADFSYHNDYVSLSAPGVEIWSACSGDIVDLLKSASKKNYEDKYGQFQYYTYSHGRTSVGWIIRQDEDDNYYYRSDGTSMAAPFVTACYAMLYSDISKRSAEDFGLPAWDADADKYFLDPAHKALLAAAATYGDQGYEGYDEYFGYGTVSVQGFAAQTVEQPLVAIEYEHPIPAGTDTVAMDEDDTDWVMVCVALLAGVILIWGINLFRAYLNRRKSNDSESEQ